jgi:hypothetical protein
LPEKFCCAVPINLFVEKMALNISSLETNEEQKTFSKIFVKKNSPMENFSLQSVNRRQLYEWKRIVKTLNSSKDYIRNAYAITSLFILNGSQKMRTFVHKEVSFISIKCIHRILMLSLSLSNSVLTWEVFL